MTPRELIILGQENKGISQAELAKKLKISRSAVSSALCRDDGCKMSIEKLVRWLYALDMQIVVQDMFGQDEYVLDCEEEDVDYSCFRLDRERRRMNRF